MEAEDIEAGASMGFLHYGFTLLEVPALGKLTLQTTLTSSQKKRVTLLKNATRSVLAPMRNWSGTKF